MAFGIDREKHRPLIGELLKVIDFDFLGFKSDLYTGKNVISKKASTNKVAKSTIPEIQEE